MQKIFLFIFLLSISFAGITQQRIHGLVLSSEERQPVPFATISYTKKYAGTITDSLGRFQFRLPRNSKLSDTVVISAIGFEKKFFSIKEFSLVKEILLQTKVDQLENLIIVSSLAGANVNRMTYYRNWNENGTGGEIGQVFQLPASKLKLNAVQVKINHNYDTCFVKLHIRNVGKKPVAADSSLTGFVAIQYGLYPGEEILKEEIIIPATIKYGLLEFDLADKNIQLNSSRIFIGFEIISCRHPRSDIPSFFFMGSQEGENLYRETNNSEWKPGSMYTIFINLLLK